MQKELVALVESTAKMQCEFYYTFSWENAPEHIKLGCIQEARAILSQQGIYVAVEDKEPRKETCGSYIVGDCTRTYCEKAELCPDFVLRPLKRYIPAAELLKGE